MRRQFAILMAALVLAGIVLVAFPALGQLDVLGGAL
jgi:hypothetical protein